LNGAGAPCGRKVDAVITLKNQIMQLGNAFEMVMER